MAEKNYYEVIISGFGGQGIILTGNILGKAATLFDKKNATFVQSYGPEARGGACSAQVIISDSTIPYPYVHKPDILVCMSQEGYENNLPLLPRGKLLLTDTDLVTLKSPGKKHLLYSIPATRIAENLGNKMMANIVMMGFFASHSQVATVDALKHAIKESVPGGTEEKNLAAFEAGYRYEEEKGAD